MGQQTVRQIPMFRIVIVREGGDFVAHCVEFPIASHGPTAEAARDAFAEALIRHVLSFEHVGRDPFGTPRSDSAAFEELWDRARRDGESPTPLHLPGFTTMPREQVEGSVSHPASDAVLAISASAA